MVETVADYKVYCNLGQIEEFRDAAIDRGGATAKRNETMVTVQADTGVRPGELCALRQSMLDLDNGELILPEEIQKGAGSYAQKVRIGLDPLGHFRTVRLLKEYLDSPWWQSKDTDYLFPTRQSNAISSDAYRKMVKSLAEEYDIVPRRDDGGQATVEDAHPHMFRHSVANYFLRSPEKDIYDLKKRLRHQRVATTESTYEHLQVV